MKNHTSACTHLNAQRLRKIAIVMLMAGSTALQAQSAEELKNDKETPGDILIDGMGYGQQRYSSLDQINTGTVKKLIPV